MNQQENIDSLNKLLTRNYDAEKGYQQIAEKTDRNDLKEFFRQSYKERYQFGHEIKEILQEYGAKPDKGSSALGDAHRAWIDLKDWLTGEDYEAIVNEAIRGEKSAIKDYEEIIDNSSLQVEHKRTLSDQLGAIKTAEAELESMSKVL
ncbi:hypothetical protein GCM10011506_03380 [Marivirga lumbricoides]|uniref:DUF2383 domain-containing protein n=1 Tax=Marivirga lumbricoides TaxID=1046115 RepID=A0ABQ1LB14_9BACT|nr:hypothetical protein GCM10011506_03380 [Marivirga lumbricoides]